MIIIPIDHIIWRKAKKVKNIYAKPMVGVVDSVLSQHLQLVTLEGVQGVKPDSMFCIGTTMQDPWQQSAKKLLDKYTVTDVVNGWLICTPKPDNEVNVYEIDLPIGQYIEQDPNNRVTTSTIVSVKAQWGERQIDGTYLQFGNLGDYVCQNPNDPTDVWIVRKAFFESTYEIIVGEYSSVV